MPLLNGRKEGRTIIVPVLILLYFLSPSWGMTYPQVPAPDDLSQTESVFLPGTLLLEIGGGWYKIADARFEEIFSKGSGIITLAVHPLLKSWGLHSLGVAAGIKRFTQDGESTVTQQDIRLTLVSLFLGTEYTLNLEPFSAGIEMGADFGFYKERSPLMTTQGSTAGYHIQGNLMVRMPLLPSLKIKLYVRHSKLPAQEAIRVNLGGLEYGVGLLLNLNFSKTPLKEKTG